MRIFVGVGVDVSFVRSEGVEEGEGAGSVGVHDPRPVHRVVGGRPAELKRVRIPNLGKNYIAIQIFITKYLEKNNKTKTKIAFAVSSFSCEISHDRKI